MQSSANPSNTGRNVLIVDDEARLSRFVSICLERAGYATATCETVDEARRLLQSDGWSLVLTDLVMPQETGFDLLQWIDAHYPSLPVIVLTAHSSPAVTKQVAQARAVAMLQKPFSLQELYNTVSLVMAA